MKFKYLFRKNKEKIELEKKFEDFIDDMDEMFDLYDVGRRAWKKYDMQRKRATVEIYGNDPIIILPVGDLHIGHIAVDIHELISNWKEFLRTDNIFLVLMGDYIEHFILMSGVFGIFEQILTPDMQMRFFEKLIGIAPERILSALASRGRQHDAQSYASIGYSLIANTLGRYDIPCLGNQGLLKVKINDIVYKIALAHHGRFHSYFNACHAAHQLIAVEYRDADCAITAHKHEFAMLEQFYGGKMEHLISCPTYKIYEGDRYQEKFWNAPEFLQHYCFIFYPDEKKIKTSDLEEAKQYIEWLKK